MVWGLSLASTSNIAELALAALSENTARSVFFGAKVLALPPLAGKRKAIEPTYYISVRIFLCFVRGKIFLR